MTFDTESPDEQQVRTWAMALHLSQFAAYFVPIAGIVAPIVIWQLQKDKMPQLDPHGRNIVNWLISQFIYLAISGLLVFVLIGFPLLIVFSLLGVIFPIIGAVKAMNGEVWKYPLTIEFIGPN
ncbi:DUF4870 domain-containing protein [Planctomicrobium sp. SH664]|uniref:DUF4870 domain-containing protein n=1 Tax=Planctomicrobium sp. SH664 TaxID=3448125 RepID=UPI003F5C5CB5